MNNDEDIDLVKQMVHCADAAYLDSDDLSGQLENLGFQESIFFEDIDSDTQAYILTNQQDMVLVFRGTENIQDWMTDLQIGWKLGPGNSGLAHAGFTLALETVWQDIIQYIQRNQRWRRLIITGHSLGGALATLAACHVRFCAGRTVDRLITFGCPRLADMALAGRIKYSLNRRMIRVVNNNDVVPRIPFRQFGYQHPGNECWYIDHDGYLHTESMQWAEKLKDRLSGRIDAFLQPGTDGVNDHRISAYVQLVNAVPAHERMGGG